MGSQCLSYPATFPFYAVELLWLLWAAGGQPTNGDRCFSDRPTDDGRQQNSLLSVSPVNLCTSGRIYRHGESCRDESNPFTGGSRISKRTVCVLPVIFGPQPRLLDCSWRRKLCTPARVSAEYTGIWSPCEHGDAIKAVWP